MKTTEALQLIAPSVRRLKRYHVEPEILHVKLNQNENPFDWPTSIKKEITDFFLDRPWNRYPDFIPDSLRSELASYIGVSKENIIIGNGSNEMLLVLLLSLVNDKKKLIVCQPTFTVYQLLSEGIGAESLLVNLKEDLQFDEVSLFSAIDKNANAPIILCSPNNPTGTSLSELSIRSILDRTSGFLILDQAYTEFGSFNAVPLLAEYSNLIITRTFSKAFAGAGLRLGYMIGNAEIIAEMNKIKLPYNINFFSEHVATVLIKNRELMRNTIKTIITEREKLFDFLKMQPIENVYQSDANFILIRTEMKTNLLEQFQKSGILVRDVSSYPMLSNCLRISIGSPEENNRLKEVVTEFFCR